jgi:hypothetical protein
MVEMARARTPLEKRLTAKKAFLRSALLCALAGAIVFGLNLNKIEHLPLNSDPLAFSPARAHQWMTDLSKKFPGRVTWAEPRKRAALWLKDEFRKLGYKPQGMGFSEVIAGKRYTDLENVYAEKRGTTHPDEIIAVVAHYDITDTTEEGAADDASGVGVVLELARVFANVPTDRTILFLLTDSEEFGAFWGARSFARDFPRASQIIAAANFDFITPERQTKVLMLNDGLQGGYTPLWLRELALDSLRSVTAALPGVEVGDMPGAIEFVERALQIPPSDHGAFIAAGIPSFNWVGQPENFAKMMAHYHHTPHDRAEAIQPESFLPFGQGAERLIRSLDELGAMPPGFRESSYWKITEHLYIPGWAATLIHVLAFVPFLVFSAIKFEQALRFFPRAVLLDGLRNEAKNVALLLGSLLFGYVIMRLLPAIKVIDQYEVFPATQKSVLLYNPNFLAMLAVIACVLAVYWVLKRSFAAPLDSRDDASHASVRHAFHAVLMAAAVFFGLTRNTYLTVLSLLPPVYFWMALESGVREFKGRLLNALLLLGGSITLVVMTIVMSSIFHVGVVYWYLFLSATYGLISVYTVCVFLMSLTVMIRLARTFVFHKAC